MNFSLLSGLCVNASRSTKMTPWSIRADEKINTMNISLKGLKIGKDRKIWKGTYRTNSLLLFRQLPEREWERLKFGRKSIRWEFAKLKSMIYLFEVFGDLETDSIAREIFRFNFYEKGERGWLPGFLGGFEVLSAWTTASILSCFGDF